MEEVNEEELLAADQNKYTKITELNLLVSHRKRRIQEMKEKAKQIKEELKREENDKVSRQLYFHILYMKIRSFSPCIDRDIHSHCFLWND